MVSYATFDAWMKDDGATRRLIATITYYNVLTAQDETLRFSNLDSIYNLSNAYPYDPVIQGGVDIQQSIDHGEITSAKASWGSLNIFNEEGRYDYLILDRDVDGRQVSHIMKNGTINIKMGDIAWPDSDYYDVFSGLIADISADSDRISFIFKDKMQRLNSPIRIRTLNDMYTALQGGTYTIENPNPAIFPPGTPHPRLGEKDSQLPLIFGEVFNWTPMSMDFITTNSTDLWFMVHDGPIEDILAIRDNGVTLARTPTASSTTATVGGTSYTMLRYAQYNIIPALGLIQLTKPNFGNVTCDVKGAKHRYKINEDTDAIQDLGTATSSWAYFNDPGNLVLNLCLSYGIMSEQLEISDLKLASLLAFQGVMRDTSNPLYSASDITTTFPAIGLGVTSKENLGSLINNILSSVSSFCFFDDAGLLNIEQFGSGGAHTKGSIKLNHILENGLDLQELEAPIQGIIDVGYGKNWSPADAASYYGSVSSLARGILSKEFGELKVSNTAAIGLYKLSTSNPEISPTLLMDSHDADAEADRRINRTTYRKVVVKLNTVSDMWDLSINRTIKLDWYKLNLTWLDRDDMTALADYITPLIIGTTKNLVDNKYTVSLLYIIN